MNVSVTVEANKWFPMVRKVVGTMWATDQFDPVMQLRATVVGSRNKALKKAQVFAMTLELANVFYEDSDANQ